MIHLFFETHATSLDNAAGIASGWNDVELSPVGEQQARELGPRNQARGVSAVFCSDLRRSYRTAEIAFAGSAIRIARDARLRECDYGDWNGRPASEIEAVRQRHLTSPFPNGESYEQVVHRVGRSLEAMTQGVSGPLLIVGHRATFFALESLIRGIPLADVVSAPWKWQPGWEYVVQS
jgi:broad specificity phosphatase PhoE